MTHNQSTVQSFINDVFETNVHEEYNSNISVTGYCLYIIYYHYFVSELDGLWLRTNCSTKSLKLYKLKD